MQHDVSESFNDCIGFIVDWLAFLMPPVHISFRRNWIWVYAGESISLTIDLWLQLENCACANSTIW